jgi:hypothetical protein
MVKFVRLAVHTERTFPAALVTDTDTDSDTGTGTDVRGIAVLGDDADAPLSGGAAPDDAIVSVGFGWAGFRTGPVDCACAGATPTRTPVPDGCPTVGPIVDPTTAVDPEQLLVTTAMAITVVRQSTPPACRRVIKRDQWDDSHQ